MELVDVLPKTPVTFCGKLLQAFDTQTRPSQRSHDIAQGPGKLKFRFLRFLSPFKMPPPACHLWPAPAKVVTVQLECALVDPETGGKRMLLRQQEDAAWLQ